MDELLPEFVAETREGLERLEQGLLAVEAGKADAELLRELFRILHTIKGTCGFLGLERLGRIAHAAENVLAAARDGSIILAGATDPLLAALDAMREIVDALEAGAGERQADDSALFAQLGAMLQGSRAADGSHTVDAGAAGRQPGGLPDVPGEVETDAGLGGAAGSPAGGTEQGTWADASVPTDPTGSAAAGEDGAEDAERTSAAAEPTATAADGRAGSAEARDGSQTAAEGETALGSTAGAGARGEEAVGSLRVPVQLLDALVAHVSELVLTRNQLLRIGRQLGCAELDGVLQRLDQVTGELREGVMKTRMQPISRTWTGLPRLVRDLARELGKSVRLVTEGGATELDRRMLDALREPLTHLVRNALDHGIEPPAERRAAGKPETGTLRIAAHQDGGAIVVTVEDDGRGLDLARIRERAIERGLLTPREAQSLPAHRIAELIFQPGFSTARGVSRVSGRGVGMDVVKSRIEGIGGKVEICPREEGGTRVRLTLPLTLAIVPALLVEAAGLPFAVPQLAVREVVRLDDADGRRIARIDGRRVLQLRGEPLPLVSLAAELGYAASEGEERFALVLAVDGRRLAVAVDRIRDTEEIVVEPVSHLARGVPALGGTTILGDGSVAMVLEPRGLTGGVPAKEPAEETQSGAETERTPLLRFRRDGRLQAVPLGMVERIHRLAEAGIPCGGSRALVLLGEEPLPVILRDGEEAPAAGSLLLVLRAEDRRFALVIDEVADILEAVLEPSEAGRREGILGCAVVEGALTELLDAAAFAERLFGSWVRRRRRGGPRPRVLVVEDSRFFRELLVPLLRGAGCDVRTAANGREALEILQSGTTFDLVLSDLEMPEMDGFQLARILSRDPRFAGLPLVALSSRATPEDVARARECGFAEHVAKLDRARLVGVLDRIAVRAETDNRGVAA